MNGWDVRPTLERIVACSSGRIVRNRLITAPGPDPARQRLTYELRLSTLVILSRPAPQPAAGDSAVAQPTTTPFTGLVRAPEPIGDMPPRHIPRPTSLRALHCVPSAVVVRAWLPEPCPAATGGSGFTIETGSESAIGINLPAFMQQVTNTHVKRWKEHRHEIGYGHLYQGRYKCFPVETEGYFYQVVRYLERNALRANLVERAESWRWSILPMSSAKTRRFPSSRRGLCHAPPIGSNCQPRRTKENN